MSTHAKGGHSHGSSFSPDGPLNHIDASAHLKVLGLLNTVGAIGVDDARTRVQPCLRGSDPKFFGTK